MDNARNEINEKTDGIMSMSWAWRVLHMQHLVVIDEYLHQHG